MEQNKIRTYLLYALGEIFLVVIGILIALQINNWNERQNDRRFETTMLKELIVSLSRDSTLIANSLEPRVLVKEYAIDTLMSLGGESNGLSKEHIIDLYMRSSTRFIYTFNSGPYETLKSNGLNLISNDLLRANITRAYEVAFPARQEMVLNPKSEYNDELLVLEKDFLAFNYFTSDEGKWELGAVSEVNDILNHPSFKRALYLQQDMATRYRDHINILKRTNSNLVQNIRNELELRGGYK